MRELTAYEELCLDRIEAETHKEQLRAALEECRLVLAGQQKHVLLLRSNPARDGLYDAGELWELIVDRHDDEAMSVLAGAAIFSCEPLKRNAYRLVNDVLVDLAAEHADQSARRAIEQELYAIAGIEA